MMPKVNLAKRNRISGWVIMIHVWKITVIIEVTVISERQAKRENWSGGCTE
jgi:hypothetical protein